ncbi:MAG: efflux RND transporter periplasmic adaptor subunit [Candidatus Cloacimonetes bacterium]|jgi:HlyD family secretion protein|nr:efflux RND transporter periplasmic adaptor subunit [Candidatus Cloacimonadota bacterium]MDD4155524.1 efflux RND transporter periplasmic adaptor subunit [Candidatus Cloacimonadota bacterium]
MKKSIIIVLVIIAIISAFYFFKKDKNVVKSINIPKVPVTKGEISIKIEETGEIQPQSIVTIKSKVSGKVVKLYVDENDYVENGDLIADIEPDYNQARTIANVRNEVRRAEISYKNAQKDLEEAQVLFEKQFISSDELETASDNVEKARLDLDLANQQFALIEDIETIDNVSRVYSTTSGTVIERLIEVGEMVQSSTSSYSEGTILFKVADLNEMIVKTSINEVDISKLPDNKQDDSSVNIRIDAFPYDNFTGKISKVGAQAKTENNVKVFPVEIEILQKDNRLRPGLSANVSIIGETRKDILTIPIRAIFSDNSGNDIVYKVVNDTIGSSVLIRTGINDLQKVEILEGLTDKDFVSLKEP